MKIEEVISLYEFIGNTSWWGWLGLALFASPIIIATLHFLLKDVDWSLDIKNRFSIGSILLFLVAMLFLKCEGDNRKNLIGEANQLKNYMILKRWKTISEYNATYAWYNCDTTRLGNIIKAFPNEFVEIKLNPPVETSDTSSTPIDTSNCSNLSKIKGVRLVDNVALQELERKTDYLLPYAKEKIRYYMETDGLESISYQTIRNSIDNDFDDELLDRMQAKYDTLFTPINIDGKMGIPGLKMKQK